MESNDSPVIQMLVGMLRQKPTSLEITILGTGPEPSPSEEGEGEDTPPLSLSQSLILIEEERPTLLPAGKDSTTGDGEKKYKMEIVRPLGIDARNLPWMTREIRRVYKSHRKANLVPFLSTGSNADTNRYIPENVWKTMLDITSCLLLVNPDHATVWADRRRCLLQQEKMALQQTASRLSCWKDELDFVSFLMTQHSKAPSSWGHRKYVVNKYVDVLMEQYQATEQENSPPTTTYEGFVSLLRRECKTCNDVARSFPKNYYAWTHRRHMWNVIGPNLAMLSSSSSTSGMTSDVTLLPKLLRQEFSDVSTWLHGRVSDHSAAHYGCQVLQLWFHYSRLTLKSEEDTMDNQNVTDQLVMIAKTALEDSKTLVQQFPDHETLWIFRRLVIRELVRQVHNFGTNTSTNDNDVDGHDISNQIATLVQQELEVECNDVKGEVPKIMSILSSGNGNVDSQFSVHKWTYLIWCFIQLQQQQQQKVASEKEKNSMTSKIIVDGLKQLVQMLIPILRDHRHPSLVANPTMWKNFEQNLSVFLEK